MASVNTPNSSSRSFSILISTSPKAIFLDASVIFSMLTRIILTTLNSIANPNIVLTAPRATTKICAPSAYFNGFDAFIIWFNACICKTHIAIFNRTNILKPTINLVFIVTLFILFPPSCYSSSSAKLSACSAMLLSSSCRNLSRSSNSFTLSPVLPIPYTYLF